MLRKRSWYTTSLHRLEVGPQHRLLEVVLADVAAGVDVDRRERLALVDDQVAARLEPDLAAEVRVDPRLDAELVEDRLRALVELEPRLRLGDELVDELLHLLVALGRSRPRCASSRAFDEVADHAQRAATGSL